MTRRPLLIAIWATLLLALPGCGDDPTGIEALVGQYTLIDVDGDDLPATTDSTQTSVTKVTGGTLFLDSDTRYAMTVRFEVTAAGGQPQPSGYVDEGTFSVEEAVILLESSRSVTWTGIVEDPTVRVAVVVEGASDEAVDLRFRPQ